MRMGISFNDLCTDLQEEAADYDGTLLLEVVINIETINKLFTKKPLRFGV